MSLGQDGFKETLALERTVNLADFEGWITLFPPGCGPGSGPDDDGNPDIPAVYLAMKVRVLPERRKGLPAARQSSPAGAGGGRRIVSRSVSPPPPAPVSSHFSPDPRPGRAAARSPEDPVT